MYKRQVYSQDASVLGGSVGEMHARKIAGLYDLASKTGAPVIGLIDSTGLRLQEATDALNGFGEIYRKQDVYKRQGYSFAFIKAGSAKSGLDPYYAVNMAGATAAGMKVGVYIYSYATTVALSLIHLLCPDAAAAV